MPTIPFTGLRGMRLPFIVVAATAMAAAGKIIHHHMDEACLSHPAWSDPVVQNFTAVIGLIHNSSILVEHVANGTWNPADHIPKIEPVEFYTWSLVIQLAFFALGIPLQYYWHIWLERILPMRPRGGGSTSAQAEKINVGEGHQDHEEEIVKRWIATGKVKRASLSYWNTFLKWILDITVGNTILGIVENLRILACKRKRSMSPVDFALNAVFSAVLYWPTIYTLASLLSMALVPARHRVLFKQGMGLLGSVSVSVAMYIIYPRLQMTNQGQAWLAMTTEMWWVGAHKEYAYANSVAKSAELTSSTTATIAAAVKGEL